VTARDDWGENELDKFYRSSDPSTKNLFQAIHDAAPSPTTASTPAILFSSSPASESDKLERDKLEMFIAEKRVFIYNVWPWFRCAGAGAATGSVGIHSTLHFVPEVVKWLSDLVACLKPAKIATLGAWAYNNNPTALTKNIAAAAPGFFIPTYLATTPFNACMANCPCIRHFYHPAFSPTWGRRPGWFGAYTIPVLGTNKQAFIDFIK
jgi:hypothetical protein